MKSGKNKSLKPSEISYHGRTIQIYNISQLAVLVNKAKSTLKRWNREKILPAPFFYKEIACNLKHRGPTFRKEFYSLQEVSVLQYLLDKYNVHANRPIPKAFVDEVKSSWEDIRQKFEAGKFVPPASKFVWRFDNHAHAVRVFRAAFSFPTENKAEEAVAAVHSAYMRTLGQGAP